MASTSSTEIERRFFFANMKRFPPVIDGRINVMNFLEASTDLVSLVERLGKVFAPVKYDMQGNIDKVKKFYEFNEKSCLLELILYEVTKGKIVVAEGLLWLNRAFLFFELAFQEIIACLQLNNSNTGMKKIFTTAYEGSVKQYHNWVTQQLFTLICKMSPTLPQIMKSIEVDHDVKAFQTDLTDFNIKLHLIRCKIDDFFKEHGIFNNALKYTE